MSEKGPPQTQGENTLEQKVGKIPTKEDVVAILGNLAEGGVAKKEQSDELGLCHDQYQEFPFDPKNPFK